MAHKVYISSDMSVDEKLIEVSEANSQYVLLWPWILTAFDDWGRAEANAKRLKAQVFPMIDCVTVQNINEALSLFSQSGLIKLYSINEKQYMSVPHEKWFKYQTHIRKEKREKDESRFPAPDSDDSTYNAQVREDARDNAEVSEDTRICIPSPSPSPSLSLSLSLSKDDGVKKNIFDAYQEIFVTPMNKIQESDLIFYLDNQVDSELLIHDFKIAKRNNKHFGYALSIIKNQYEQGIKTLAQLELLKSQKQVATGGEQNATYSGHRQEVHGSSQRTRSITGGKVGRV